MADKTIPIGQCFPWAFREQARLAKLGDEDNFLVHAQVQDPWDAKKYWHAWLEKDGLVLDWQTIEMRRWEPQTIKAFNAVWKPKKIKKYTRMQAIQMLLKFKHLGPWHGPEKKFRANPDDELRDLERAARAQGDSQSQAKLLLARIRHGLLAPPRLVWAAALGSEGADLACTGLGIPYNPIESLATQHLVGIYHVLPFTSVVEIIFLLMKRILPNAAVNELETAWKDVLADLEDTAARTNFLTLGTRLLNMFPVAGAGQPTSPGIPLYMLSAIIYHAADEAYLRNIGLDAVVGYSSPPNFLINDLALATIDTTNTLVPEDRILHREWLRERLIQELLS